MRFKNYLFVVIAFLLVSFASAATQFTNPSLSSVYASTDINTYWPQLAEDIQNGKCEGNTDFLVMIPPAGCTPSVIRTDLLAEQNVPVFCQLESAKVNPLIKVSSIKSISFKGQYPAEIAGVSYYPARAALNSYSTLLGSPVVNNIGYVVIILKKESNESSNPKNISGNLTATLYYDAQKAYGVGSSEFYLKQMTDDEWESNKYLQGFWEGRGLLKLLDVRDDQATVQILDQAGNIIRIETLNTGQTGSKFYFPGFYCRASMQLKLNSIGSPDDSVILTVDGVQMEARKGTKLGNTGCRVTNLDVLAGNAGTVKISCSGKSLDLSLLSLYKANLTVDGKSSSYEMTSKISTTNSNYYFAYAGSTTRKVDTVVSGNGFVVLIESNSSLDNSVYSQLAKNVDSTFSNNIGVDLTLANLKSALMKGITKVKSSANIKVLFVDGKGDRVEGIIFNNLLTSKGEAVEASASDATKQLASGYFDEGDATLQTLLNDYGSLSTSPGENYGESGLYEEIQLINRLQQKGLDYSVKKVELMNQFLDKYPSSVYAESVRNELAMAQRTDSTNAYKSIFSNNQYHTIGIVQFKPAETSSKSFELYVNNKNARDDSGNIIWHEGDTISLSQIAGTKNTNDYLIVKSISSTQVTFEYYSTKPSASKDSTFISYLADGSFTLSFSQDSSKTIESKVLSTGTSNNKAYSLSLGDVVVDKVAYVSVVSDLKTNSEANFTFNIGIEKRAIQLSPEKAQAQADDLNKSIKKWEDKNAQLGTLIEGWKAVCLATGLALNIKNLITGFTGQSTARQEVMTVYKSKCKSEVFNGNFPTVDACYNKYSTEIEKDVNAYTSAIQGINSEIETQYHGNLSEFQSKSSCSYTTADGNKVSASQISSWSDARQCMLYNKLYTGTNITEGLRAEIKANTAAQLTPAANNAQANKEVEDNKNYLPALLRDTYFNAQIDNNNVKITSYKPISKSDLLSVVESGSKSSISELTGDGNLGVATTRYGNQWYLVILDSKNVHSTYTFTVSNNLLTGITPSRDNGITNDKNIAHWDVDVVTNKKCVNNYTNPRVVFYNSGSTSGNLPAYVPIDIKEGWYVYVPSTQGNTITTGASNIVSGLTGQAISGYTDAGEVTFLYLCNVGPNGREDQRQSDDICQSFNTNNNNFEAFSECGKTTSDVRNLVNKAKTAIKSVASQYKSGVTRINVPNVGDNLQVEPGLSTGDTSTFVCQDFFSVDECKLMYNLCDPVICPSSRCNFGGKIAVPNVIQSGIIGSAVLCLKNFVGFGGDVYVPVCLTGIHAGIEGYISILKAQQKCLSEYAKTGKHVGICDEMTAIYKCEFFWRQISPLMQNIIPSLAELVYTAKYNGQANGGEYATFQASWNNMQSSIDYFKNTYASTSFTAYKFGNVQEMGSTYCRNFLGTSLPTSAEAIDSLLKPESPAQFYGTFSSIPFTTVTTPATSQYKVFYHIYAGTDMGASYQIYLKDPPSLSYYTMPSQVSVATGYLTKGEQASESKDFTAPSGYKQLCLVVNNQEECGFNSISTDFAVKAINDLYVQEQGGENNITSEDGCISGSSSIYSLVNLNVQEGVDNAVNPDISLLGITRVCATQNPGKGTSSANWKNVGNCGDKNLICWLDQSSVQNAQKVLKNVGSISQAIEYLALNSTANAVYADQQQTSEDLANLRTNIGKFTLVLASTSTQSQAKSAVDSAVSSILTQAQTVIDSAKADVQKAEAYYLKAQLYYSIVRQILNIQLAKAETTVTSSVTQTVATPTASAASVTIFKNTQPSAWLGLVKTTSLYFKFINGGWQWSPDKINWMNVPFLVVSGGEYDGSKPSSSNQQIIIGLSGKGIEDGKTFIARFSESFVVDSA